MGSQSPKRIPVFYGTYTNGWFQSSVYEQFSLSLLQQALCISSFCQLSSLSVLCHLWCDPGVGSSRRGIEGLWARRTTQITILFIIPSNNTRIELKLLVRGYCDLSNSVIGSWQSGVCGVFYSACPCQPALWSQARNWSGQKLNREFEEIEVRWSY